MENTWVQGGNAFMLREISSQIENLPVAVYKIEEDPFENIFLTRMQNEFEFPYKVYGKDTEFVERVHKTWHNTTGNLGVLLNGVRGTGKTVTAQQICNIMKKPVFLLTRKHNNLVKFLNEITEDVVLFIDEYEKIFESRDSTLLTVMDGSLKTSSRILFLLTTNNTFIEQNLLQRPSRIRYIKQYTDLDLDTIIEIVDDMLIHKELRDESIKMISHLPMITIDLVKAIINEVNIHNESPEAFKSYFNADNGDNDDYVNVYKVHDDGTKELFKGFTSIYPNPLYMDKEDFEFKVNQSFEINERHYGSIKQIVDYDTILINDKVLNMEKSEKEGKPMYDIIVRQLYIENAKKKHAAFTSYVL